MATQLESSLQVSDLILQASPVVQLVMLALLLASLFSWYLIAKLHMSYKKAQADDEHFQKIFWSGAELNTLYNNAQLNSKRVGLEDIFYQGLGEFLKLKKRNAAPAQTIEGTERILRVGLSRDQSQLEQGLGALASIGSVAPYVGLFGTVWGIMNAFIGLADVDQVTLATLHPVLLKPSLLQRLVYLQRFLQYWHLTITQEKAKRFTPIVLYLQKKWLRYYNVSLWVKLRNMTNGNSTFRALRAH